MKKFLKRFRYGQKGFTLIELLVVIGILGAIAAIVVPNVGQFIGRGKTESYATELHNIETAAMAMLVDDANSTLDTAPTDADSATTDMHAITGTNLAGTTLYLSDYCTGLGDDPATPGAETTCVKLGCKYWFEPDLKGTVHQVPPS
jgi:prepilin-type N-terminal cleavage/methylation domain-containing protein